MAINADIEPQKRLSLSALVVLGLLGFGIVFASGHVQAHALHDAAHDMRHALGFPCH